MKLNKSKIFRSDNLYILGGIIMLYLTYRFFDGGRAKEGLMAEALAALIIPSIKFGMGCLACRLKFYYLRHHNFLTDTAPKDFSPGFWKACIVNVIIILAFMFAPL